jgi:hypothetical protein
MRGRRSSRVAKKDRLWKGRSAVPSRANSPLRPKTHVYQLLGLRGSCAGFPCAIPLPQVIQDSRHQHACAANTCLAMADGGVDANAILPLFHVISVRTTPTPASASISSVALVAGGLERPLSSATLSVQVFAYTSYAHRPFRNLQPFIRKDLSFPNCRPGTLH